MNRPILLAIDDDISVLEAVVQDLRRQYGSTYRVMRAGSGQAALDTLRQLKVREEAVALLLSDQRMPGMTGVEFLEHAKEIYPEARRVLLTAYADTEAAIRAINTARIHYYLTKPWDPPEEKLYPVLDDLLQDWNAGYQPKFEGLRVIGHRWSLKDHQLRSFLSRNHVPTAGWMRRPAMMPSSCSKSVRWTRKCCRWCCLPTAARWWTRRRTCWRRGWACAPRRRRISTT
jgi:thioredoxin reductase (NADPH)